MKLFIEVRHDAELSKRVQEFLFSLGFKWASGGRTLKSCRPKYFVAYLDSMYIKYQIVRAPKDEEVIDVTH